MKELDIRAVLIFFACLTVLKLVAPAAMPDCLRVAASFAQGGCSYGELTQALGRGDYSYAVEVMTSAVEGRKSELMEVDYTARSQ